MPICVKIIMVNKYLNTAEVYIPISPNAGCKIAVESHAPAGVTCINVTRQDEALTENVPEWAVTNGWFTINALQKTGSALITFNYSDGVTEQINVKVYDPSAPPTNTDVSFTVPKSAQSVTLIIER